MITKLSWVGPTPLGNAKPRDATVSRNEKTHLAVAQGVYLEAVHGVHIYWTGFPLRNPKKSLDGSAEQMDLLSIRADNCKAMLPFGVARSDKLITKHTDSTYNLRAPSAFGLLVQTPL